MEDQDCKQVLSDLNLKKQLEERALEKLLSYENLQKVLNAKNWKINIKIKIESNSFDFEKDDPKLKNEILSQNDTKLHTQLPVTKYEIKEEYASDYEEPSMSQGD